MRWRMFNATRRRMQDTFADLSAEEVENLVDEAVTATRQQARRVAPSAGA